MALEGTRSVGRGDLYWIAADVLRPCVPGAPHPFVVVQDDVFNHSRIPSVVVCGVTSRIPRASEPGNVVLEPGDGGLTKPSVVIVSQVCVVDKVDLGDFIGALTAEQVDRIVEGLRFVERLSHR